MESFNTRDFLRDLKDLVDEHTTNKALNTPHKYVEKRLVAFTNHVAEQINRINTKQYVDALWADIKVGIRNPNFLVQRDEDLLNTHIGYNWRRKIFDS